MGDALRLGWGKAGGLALAAFVAVQSFAAAQDVGVIGPIDTGIKYKETVEGLGGTLATILGAFLAVILGIVMFKVFAKGTQRALGGNA